MSEAFKNPSASLPGVQVVVNSYGREPRFVERAVASFLRQKHPPEHIHFIDQNDVPLKLDSRLKGETRFSHHHRPDKVGARARNTARVLAPTGWIVFCDDDGYWTEDYSEQLKKLLEAHRPWQLIAGAVIDETTGGHYSLRHQIGGRLDTFLGSKLFPGANFAIRAETFARIGGYDARFGPGTFWPSSEEADLCWRVITSGAPAVYAPQLRILHPPLHETDSRKAAQKAYAYGRGKGALVAKWIFERRHLFGFLELAEMSVVPFVNMLRGVLRGDFGQLRIQVAMLRGRYRGLWEFLTRKGAA